MPGSAELDWVVNGHTLVNRMTRSESNAGPRAISVTGCPLSVAPAMPGSAGFVRDKEIGGELVKSWCRRT